MEYRRRIMLLIASETIRSNQALNDVVREMSFTLSYFASTDNVFEADERAIPAHRDSGRIRRHSRVAPRALKAAKNRMSFAILVAADRASLRSSEQAELVDKLVAASTTLSGSALISTLTGCPVRHGVAADVCSKSPARKLRTRAREQGQFVLRYQPKVERNSGTEWLTREAEALVRWHHPEHGLMGPLEFLPEVEAFGLMGKLSEYVATRPPRSCLPGAMVASTSMPVSTSLQASLATRLLADTLCRYRSNEAGLECGRFTFEVIEQDLANPDAPHIQMLEALRKKGFRICLDDFRVAASSLGTFEQLPFDEVKIHASALQACAEAIVPR